jgi:prolyl-tRNA editing enzyme YbaK/EbsC (Cys-tRNA(Pro) deacylase)
MVENSNVLIENLKSKNIWFRVYSGKDMSTSVLASKTLNVPLSRIAKSILLIDNSNKPLLVILPGNCRIKTKIVKAIFKVKDVRLAYPHEVKNLTNFEVGGLPPVFHKIERVVVDKKLLTNETVFCGGGAKDKIVEMKIEDIVKLNNALIEDVSVQVG